MMSCGGVRLSRSACGQKTTHSGARAEIEISLGAKTKAVSSSEPKAEIVMTCAEVNLVKAHSARGKVVGNRVEHWDALRKDHSCRKHKRPVRSKDEDRLQSKRRRRPCSIQL